MGSAETCGAGACNGEATISVAGVDLIYLGLNVVLTAVSNLKKPNAVAPSRGRDG